MSHPLYNPRGATFPNSQRPIVHGQYGSLGSQSGLELGASRLGPGSMSTSRGGLMVNQQMPFALGQHQSQISQDFEAAIDRNIMGAREEVRRLTQILQQPKTADPRLRKDTRNEGLSSGRTGYTGTGGSSRSNKVDWSLYQAPNKPFASSSLDRSSCSTQEFQYSGFGGSGAARSLDSQPPPEQRPSRYTPENASSILANFGLSNEDLELLSHCPEDQLTLDNLPVVLREIRMRKANRNIADIDARSELMGSDPRHSKVIDYGHFSKFGYPEESADGYAREHLPKESPKYGREVPGPPFSGMGITKRPPLCQAASGPAQDPRPTNPFPARPSASQFILPSSSQPPSQMPLPQMLSPSQMPPQLGVLPLMTNNDISGGPSSKWIPFLSSPISAPAAKRLPTPTMMNDYSAATPRIFPHTCSLCIIECFQIKDWIEHQNTNLHIERCRLLRKQYPDWNVEAVSVSRPEPKSEYSSLKRRTRSHSYSRSPSPKRHHDSSSHRKRSRSPRQDDAKERVATAYPALRGFPVGDFPLEQKRDETLRHAFNQVKVIDGQCLQPGFALSYPYFSIIKDRLYRVTQDSQTKEDTTQLLIPQSRREMLFQTAHCNPMAGHLGQEKTLNRLMVRFYWPGIRGDVRRWCAACRDCQLVNPPATPKVPLHPLPLIEVPFERIGMDLVGPLERTARGHRFVLVLVDYATRYPEAVPLRNISVRSVAEALFRIISRVGIPKEIFTDQGTTFMSRTLRELYDLLGIKSVRTSVYHPQTDGLVEQFNQTLKSVIFKFVHDDAWNWDKWLEPLLFAVREVPQASTGFSPFELLYGRRPRSVLDVLRENWVEGPSNSKNEIQYILDLRAKLHTLGQLTQENLLQAQERQSRLYNKDTRLREFTPGDKILVLLPTSSSKLLAKWQGPFEVTRRVSEIDYEVKRTDRGGARQIYHLNLLKPWREVVPMTLATVVPEEEEAGAEQTIHTSLCMEREEDAKALPNCKNLTVHGKVIEISMEKDARDDDRNKSVQTEKTVNKEVTTTKPTQSVKVESTNTVKAPLSTKAKESTSVKTSPVTKAPQKPSDPKKSVQTAKAKPPAKGSERPVTKKIVKKAVRWRKNIVEVSDLPEEGVTEDELTKFAKPYGLISTPVIAITQQRAFLQMLNTEAAEAMVKACSEIPVKIQEKQITVKMMQPIDLYYAESLFRVLVGMKKSPVKKKPQAKGAKAPGKSAATEGKPNTIKAQKPAAAASTTDGAATSEATPTVGTASAQDNMTAVPPITTDQVTRTDADIMTEEPAVSLESSKAKIEVGSSILSSESAVADESEKAELELASSGLFEEHAVSVESVNVKHELASPVPTTEDTADKMETRTEETMPFAEVVESQKQEENEPQEESMDNQLETVAVEPVVVESESTELYTHLGASAPAEDFSEEAADEEQHSMAEEGPEALLTVDEVVDEETGGEEYQLDKELQGLVTLDEIAEEEELDSFKPETLVTLDETKGDDEEIEEVEQSETKTTSPNFKTPPRPEEPAQSPSQEEDACDLEEFCTMNFVTVDEVWEEEEEQPPSEEVKVQEAVKKTATRAKKRARQTSVRRSTRGKRGAAESDKEPEEPEMSAEGESAPTAPKPESPPSAPDPVELDKPDSQKAETVRVPDSSSAEVVSSGSEERTGVKVDDNSESERVVVETPVADKKTTIKEESKQRRETETKEAPEAKKVCSHSPVIEDFTLPPYSPDNPIGADFVVPKTGFFCRLCSLFYGNEETAKKSHCGSLRHYQNMEKYYKKLKSQQQRGKSTLTTSSQSSASE